MLFHKLVRIKNPAFTLSLTQGTAQIKPYGSSFTGSWDTLLDPEQNPLIASLRETDRIVRNISLAGWLM